MELKQLHKGHKKETVVSEVQFRGSKNTRTARVCTFARRGYLSKELCEFPYSVLGGDCFQSVSGC